MADIKSESLAGFASEYLAGLNRNLHARQSELESFIKARQLKTIGSPVYAFYNPPWTLPFLRRNEILWQVA